MRVTSSDIWLKSSNLRVMGSNPQLRVQIHTSYEVKSTSDEQELKFLVRRWKSRVEAIKPRIR